MRSKTSSKNSYLLAVCDTPVLRTIGFVSSLGIYIFGDFPYNCSSVACTRVNRAVIINLCAEVTKTGS